MAYAHVKDSALTEGGSGGYLITRGAGGHKLVVGTIDAPWATDAAGRPVPTDYRLEGVMLVQTVTPSSATTFPVVADPKLTYGVGIYFNATGAEWKSYAIAAGSVGYFADVVGCGFTEKIPHAALKRAARPADLLRDRLQNAEGLRSVPQEGREGQEAQPGLALSDQADPEERRTHEGQRGKLHMRHR
ncbi:hypothetical protein AB0G29_01075 [Streptomyces parvus]|uniref:hypothetical protein n=1 Tax=Streptomyces parvus TaxID=66428 RepID=UPI0033E2DC54